MLVSYTDSYERGEIMHEELSGALDAMINVTANMMAALSGMNPLDASGIVRKDPNTRTVRETFVDVVLSYPVPTTDEICHGKSLVQSGGIRTGSDLSDLTHGVAVAAAVVRAVNSAVVFDISDDRGFRELFYRWKSAIKDANLQGPF